MKKLGLYLWFISALLTPIIYLIYNKKILPRSVFILYACIFTACAFGWELWFTYGWIDGDPVNIRRSAALNTWIPQDINWLMNSLADAGNYCTRWTLYNLVIV